MAVTVAEAAEQLNITVPTDAGDLAELTLYVAAANEWIASKVTDAEAAARPSVTKLATLFLIEHWWESQRGPAATPLAGDEIVTIGGKGYAVPNRVLELIGAAHAPTSASYSFPDAVAWPDAVEPCAP